MDPETIQSHLWQVKEARDKHCLAIGTEWFKATGAGLRDESKLVGLSYDAYLEEKLPHLEADYVQIKKDIPRSRPESFRMEQITNFLQPLEPKQAEEEGGRGGGEGGEEKEARGGGLLGSLERVLRAFVAQKSAVGYCQGMNSLVVFLLAFMEEEETFWTFSFIVSSLRPPDFYSGAPFNMNGLKIMTSAISAFIERLHLLSPRTLALLDDEGLDQSTTVQLFCTGGLTTMFVDYLPLQHLLLFWDVFLRDKQGDYASVLTALALAAHADREIAKKIPPDGGDAGGSLDLLSISASNTFREASLSIPFDFLEGCLRAGAADGPGVSAASTASSTLPLHINKPSIQEVKAEYQRQRRVIAENMSSEGANLWGTMKATQISEGDIKRYQAAFRNMRSEDGTINEDQFVKIICSTPAAADNNDRKSSSATSTRRASTGIIPVELGRALYAAADSDRSGGVDFRELMVSLSLLSPGPNTKTQRLQHLFDAFDTNGDGTLATSELRALATVLVRHRLRTEKYTQDSKKKIAGKQTEAANPGEEISHMYNELLDLDDNKSGGLSFRELEDGLAKCPALNKLICDMQLPVYDSLVSLGRKKSRRTGESTLCFMCTLQ